MNCRKDKGRKCGAGWRNSIFRLDAVKKSALVTYKHTTILGEAYVGCFVDQGRRDLPKLLRAGYGNYKACF